MKKENLIVILGGVIFLAIGLVITFNVIENRKYKSNDVSASISNSTSNNKIANESNEENIEGFKDTVKNDTTIKKEEQVKKIDEIYLTDTECNFVNVANNILNSKVNIKHVKI